jgi:hypothetical protein
MTSDLLRIEQAVLRGRAGDEPELVAGSPGWTDALTAAARAACAALGPRPAGVRCPGAVFARPLGRTHVAVARADDDGDGPDPPLRFHVLALDRRLYAHLGDPFTVADRFHEPPAGDLQSLEWPPERLPPRLVADLQQILKDGDGPFLLGAAQALLDGGRVVLDRDAPDPDGVRALWQLLPDASRAEKWPASFAFAPTRAFDLAAVPRAVPGEGWLTEEQARDYPEGRYELALQVAVEDGDQRGLDRLLARRTPGQAMVLGVIILVGGLVLLAAVRVIELLARRGRR